MKIFYYKKILKLIMYKNLNIFFIKFTQQKNDFECKWPIFLNNLNRCFFSQQNIINRKLNIKTFQQFKN